MILIDTPINAQEQNNDKAAHDTTYALGETENSSYHKLTLPDDCFKKFIRCWQPSLQCLLEQAAFKPGGQHPGALYRYRLGQLLKITNQHSADQEDQQNEAAEASQVEQGQK